MSETTTTDPGPWFVIPCGGAKLEGTHRAADLYVGQQFTLTLAAARNEVDDEHILILSARHGLLRLSDMVDAYDTKMGDPGSVTADQVAAQLPALGIDWGSDVYAMCPKAYWKVLDGALRSVEVYAADVYEAAPGIGYQRGVASTIARTDAAQADALCARWEAEIALMEQGMTPDEAAEWIDTADLDAAA